MCSVLLPTPDEKISTAGHDCSDSYPPLQCSGGAKLEARRIWTTRLQHWRAHCKSQHMSAGLAWSCGFLSPVVFVLALEIFRLDETLPANIEGRAAFVARLRSVVCWLNRNRQRAMLRLAGNMRVRARDVQDNASHALYDSLALQYTRHWVLAGRVSEKRAMPCMPC